ncbi:MAG: acetoacetate decarboxylase family protein [bacterium]|nr:acetoacetate decarboxylase family protein [bacterium]
MPFEFTDGNPYLMPAHFGPADTGWDGKVAHYADNTALTITYVTEGKQASALLPRGFSVTDPAVVSVTFVECRGVDFMAGGGYNLVAVNLSATFRGQSDEAVGSFALVLWENDFMPIMLGREVLGAPKLLAEIPDAWMRDGKRGFHVSDRGTRLLEGEVSGLSPLDEETAQAMTAQMAGQLWMGWKYIPSCDLKHASLSHATALPARTEIQEAWIGSGELAFHDVSWEEAPMSSRIVQTLKALPIVEFQASVLTRGSQDLLIHEQRAME